MIIILKKCFFEVDKRYNFGNNQTVYGKYNKIAVITAGKYRFKYNVATICGKIALIKKTLTRTIRISLFK
jgi:hypothetical protein